MPFKCQIQRHYHIELASKAPNFTLVYYLGIEQYHKVDTPPYVLCDSIDNLTVKVFLYSFLVPLFIDIDKNIFKHL